MNNFFKSIVVLLFTVATVGCDKDVSGITENNETTSVSYDLSRKQIFVNVDSTAFPNTELTFVSQSNQEISLNPILFSFGNKSIVNCNEESFQSEMLSIIYQNDNSDIVIPVNLSNSLAPNMGSADCKVGFRMSTGLKAASGAQELRFTFSSLFDLARVTTLGSSEGTHQVPVNIDAGYTYDELLNLNGQEYPEVYLKERAASGPHSMIAWSPRIGIVAFADRTGTRWYRKL